MNVPLKIKKIRELRSYTQEYMAESLDISQGHYNKIENGQAKITVDRLIQISKILEIDILELLKFTEDNEDTLSFFSRTKEIITQSPRNTITYIEQIKRLKEELKYLKRLINPQNF